MRHTCARTYVYSCNFVYEHIILHALHERRLSGTFISVKKKKKSEYVRMKYIFIRTRNIIARAAGYTLRSSRYVGMYYRYNYGSIQDITAMREQCLPSSPSAECHEPEPEPRAKRV